MLYLNRQIKYRFRDGKADVNPDMEVLGWEMPRRRAILWVTESRWFSVFYFLGVKMDLKRGQASLEYFIIFAIIAVLTILSIVTRQRLTWRI